MIWFHGLDLCTANALRLSRLNKWPASSTHSLVSLDCLTVSYSTFIFPSSSSPLCRCAHSAEPLNLSLFPHLCIGSPCLAVLLFSLWPMISCHKHKQLGADKSHHRELRFHGADQRKKWTGFNLVVNLTFRAFSGRTDITNSLQGWHIVTLATLDLGLHMPLQWQGTNKENNRSVSKETNASSQAVDLKGCFFLTSWVTQDVNKIPVSASYGES